VWLPEAGGAIAVTAAAPASAPAGESSVFVPSLPGLEHILVDARGRQHVVLRTNGAAMQLTISGADITEGPVALTFLVRGLGAMPEACAAFADLRRILAARRQPASPCWTARTLNLRNALIALDGRAAGASHRQIAVVLHGKKRVVDTWQVGLKERVRRHLARGIALSAGGYRRLLA
jgi:hypothetical protein